MAVSPEIDVKDYDQDVARQNNTSKLNPAPTDYFFSLAVVGLIFMVATLLLFKTPTPPVLASSKSVPVSRALHLACLIRWKRLLSM